MSLRTRLLVAVGVVLLLALATTDVAVRAQLRSSLLGELNRSLSTTSHSIAQLLEPHGHPAPPGGFSAGGFSIGALPEGAPDPAGGGRVGGSGGSTGADSGTGNGGQPPDFCDNVEYNLAPGIFVEVRSPSGKVVSGKSCAARVDARSYSPKLPAEIAGLGHAEQGPGRTVSFSAPSSVSNGPTFEVLASSLPPDLGGVLVVASPLTSIDHTLDQLLSIELVVSGAALVVGTLLGWLLVHLDLRPLRDIERTADAIAQGELESRVPGANERTEVGHVATALNVMLGRIEHAFAERDTNEAQLRASEERLRRFVADASHELRTPITAVSAYAELFEHGAASRPEDLRRAMRGIRSETARMGQLVEDLLLLARLDENRPLDRQPVELVGTASEAIDTATTVGPQWPVRLVAGEPVETQGDPLQLRQVLDNLLANVRAHTPPGTETTLAVRSDGDEAVIEVADRGPGMSPEHRRRIFDRFYRADPSRARSRDGAGSGLAGAGLGLAIVASIVAAHQGSVEVESAPGNGSTFRVRLPLRPDAPPGGTGETTAGTNGGS